MKHNNNSKQETNSSNLSTENMKDLTKHFISQTIAFNKLTEQVENMMAITGGLVEWREQIHFDMKSINILNINKLFYRNKYLEDSTRDLYIENRNLESENLNMKSLLTDTIENNQVLKKCVLMDLMSAEKRHIEILEMEAQNEKLKKDNKNIIEENRRLEFQNKKLREEFLQIKAKADIYDKSKKDEDKDGNKVKISDTNSIMINKKLDIIINSINEKKKQKITNLSNVKENGITSNIKKVKNYDNLISDDIKAKNWYTRNKKPLPKDAKPWMTDKEIETMHHSRNNGIIKEYYKDLFFNNNRDIHHLKAINLLNDQRKLEHIRKYNNYMADQHEEI